MDYIKAQEAQINKDVPLQRRQWLIGMLGAASCYVSVLFLLSVMK